MTTTVKKLPIPTKLSFGAGSLAFGLKDQAFGAFLMIYYNQVIGLPAAWVGLAMFVATLANAIADPLIGQWSDHFKSRLGRRHPFMYASALPLAIGYLLLWAPPDAAHAVQFVWLLATLILVWVAIAAFEVPSAALMAEFTDDYAERTSLSLWRTIFLALGLIGGAIVALKIFLVPTPEQPIGQLNPAGYEQFGMASAIVMLVVILVATRGTQDRIPTLAPPKPRVAGENMLSNLKLLAMDRAYMSLVGCIFLFAIGGGLIATFDTYVRTYFWQLSASQLASIAGVGGLGAIVGLVIAGATKGLDKRNLLVSAYATALVASLLLLVLALLDVVPRDGTKLMPWIMLQTAAVSAAVAIGLVIAGSMLADVADHMELKTGRRMEGLMFAALIMVQKAVTGMGNFLSGVLLTVIGFPEKADPATLDPVIIEQLGWAKVYGLGIFVSLALVVVMFYPITRQTQARTAAALRAGNAPVA